MPDERQRKKAGRKTEGRKEKDDTLAGESYKVTSKEKQARTEAGSQPGRTPGGKRKPRSK